MKHTQWKVFLFCGLFLLPLGCAKKTKTFAPTDSAPAPAVVPSTPPPAVNWNDASQVQNLPNNPNLCHTSNTNYFSGMSYVPVEMYNTVYYACGGYWVNVYMGTYYYWVGQGQQCPGGGGPPQPHPHPKPDPKPDYGCSQSSKNYDSGWEPLAMKATHGFDCKVKSGNCNNYCHGNNSRPSDYISYGGLHTQYSCNPQSSGDKFGVWGERNNALGLNSDHGAVILYRGSAVTIEVDTVDLKGSQDYYLSVDALYSGSSQKNEVMEVSVNGTVIHTIKDLHDSSNSEKWKSCYINKKICLKGGKNRIKFHGPHDSVHMDAYRLSSGKPAGLSPCP